MTAGIESAEQNVSPVLITRSGASRARSAIQSILRRCRRQDVQVGDVQHADRVGARERAPGRRNGAP